MVPSTLQQIAEVVNGTLVRVSDPDLVVSGPVVIDSRQVHPGGVFAAFVGEHVDGHSFAGQAVAGGAVCVLASRPVPGPAIASRKISAAAWVSSRLRTISIITT